MTFWFCIAFTWWLGHFISCYLKVHFMLIKYMCDSKSQTLRMRYSFQSSGRPISHLNGWTFHVYMIPLWNLLPEWNSRPGATTGMNSCWGDLGQHDILWWYHVNKCRAMRGNRSEHPLRPLEMDSKMDFYNLYLFGHPRGTWGFSKLQGLQYYFPVRLFSFLSPSHL